MRTKFLTVDGVVVPMPLIPVTLEAAMISLSEMPDEDGKMVRRTGKITIWVNPSQVDKAVELAKSAPGMLDVTMDSTFREDEWYLIQDDVKVGSPGDKNPHTEQ